MAHRSDLEALPAAYRGFHDALARVLPAERLVADPLRTFGFGTDASFHRLVPKLVVRPRDLAELSAVLAAAAARGIPLTFRTAGTSLSGQAVTDSVLVLLAGGWRGARVHPGAERITLEPGVVGADANALLAPHGRKIGPDPASIGACSPCPAASRSSPSCSSWTAAPSAGSAVADRSRSGASRRDRSSDAPRLAGRPRSPAGFHPAPTGRTERRRGRRRGVVQPSIPPTRPARERADRQRRTRGVNP